MDDEPDRLKNFPRRAIGNPEQLAGRTADLSVIKLGPDNGAAKVLQHFDNERAKGRRPDLVVIDQMLQLWDNLMQRGSSLAVAIRDKDPSVAVVGVTGMTGAELEHIEELQKEQFIEFYARDEIASGDHIPDLFAIADGHAALTKFYASNDSKGSSIATYVCRLLKCPTGDIDLLTAALPGTFKKPWDAGTSHSLARWIWHQLLGRPGLLYDDLGIATLLGLKVDGLALLTPILADCQYKGVFASVSKPRWWVSQVRDAIRGVTKANSSEPLTALGRKLVGPKEAGHFSKCYGRPALSEAPTVVAFSDGTLRRRVQARIADTVPVSTDSPPFGFEQRRMYTQP